MQLLIFNLVLTTLTGVGGLALGGLLACLLRRQSQKSTCLLLSFTAGLMLCIVSMDLIPEALHAADTPLAVVIALLGGFTVTHLLNSLVDRSVHHSDASHPHRCACGHHDLRTAGIVLAAAVALHNLPIGLAVGTTVAAEGMSTAAVLAALTIGLHNIPEGMSIAVPLLHDRARAGSAIAVAALSGLPTVLGAILGFFLGSQAPLALSVALGAAGGAMLYVVFFELLPEAYGQWRSKWPLLATVLGFALALALLLLLGHNHIHSH